MAGLVLTKRLPFIFLSFVVLLLGYKLGVLTGVKVFSLWLIKLLFLTILTFSVLSVTSRPLPSMGFRGKVVVFFALFVVFFGFLVGWVTPSPHTAETLAYLIATLLVVLFLTKP